MSAEELELKLLDNYHQEVQSVIDQFAQDVSSAPDFETQKRRFKEGWQRWQRQMEIYEKQLVRVKTISPNNTELKRYEAFLYDFRAFHRMQSAAYARQAGGIFASESKELREAIRLCDQALSIFEYPAGRLRKVQCYIQLSDKASALQELDRILRYYADNEEIYLKARKMKDELENPPTSGIGRFFRSIFG